MQKDCLAAAERWGLLKCLAASTGAWVLQRSVKDPWRRCGAFEAFEGVKSQSRKCIDRLSGASVLQRSVKNLWRRRRAFEALEAFEGAKSQSRKRMGA